MMVILARSEAVVLASFLELFSLTEEERLIETQDALDDGGIEEASDSEKSIVLREYLEQRFSSYTNKYIQIFLAEKLGASVGLDGEDVKLYPCPCCGYRTLKESAEYFICAVCYWEDDGTLIDTSFSRVNSMTLLEAKNNFNMYGVILEKYKSKVDDTRFIKYALLD